MQKILLTLFLISCSAILFLPMVARAAVCTYSTCTQGPIPVAENGCTCGGVAASTGYLCCAAVSPYVYVSLGSCPTSCGGTGGGVPGAGTTGPLNGCTMTRDVGVTNCPTSGRCEFSDPAKPCGACCFLQTLSNVTDWIFVILISLSGLFVVLGSMNLIMSGGDSAKIKSGREYVQYAVIGLIVGFLARAIPAIVRFAVGV